MTALQIVLGVLTVVMSGVVAAVVTFRLNARREDRQFRRQQLERMFLAFVGFCRNLDVHWSPYMFVMGGKIDYNQALDATNESGKNSERNLENVEMLAAIYWPELRSHVNALKQVRDDGNSVLRDHRTRYQDGHTEDKKSFDAIKQVGSRLDEVKSRFGEAVRREAVKLRSGPSARAREPAAAAS